VELSRLLDFLSGVGDEAADPPAGGFATMRAYTARSAV
jgi:hypothetical protein